jgi:hypothetical protein
MAAPRLLNDSTKPGFLRYLLPAVVVEYVFGFDVFISCARRDGRTYAEQLHQALSKLDYSCFFDAREVPAGEQLTTALRRESRRVRSHRPLRDHRQPRRKGEAVGPRSFEQAAAVDDRRRSRRPGGLGHHRGRRERRCGLARYRRLRWAGAGLGSAIGRMSDAEGGPFTVIRRPPRLGGACRAGRRGSHTGLLPG